MTHPTPTPEPGSLLDILFGDTPTIEPAPRPVVKQAAPRERHYFRCLDCLSVFAVDGAECLQRETDPQGYRPLILKCGACSGRVEHMGQVAADRLVRYEHRCPCDHRCTNAVGPSCDCRCGGVNHGSGMVVRVVASSEGIPVAQIPRASHARMIADEYRAAVAAAKTRIAWAYATIEAKRRGEWIRSYADLTAAQRIVEKVSQARAYRTHKRRISALEAIR